MRPVGAALLAVVVRAEVRNRRRGLVTIVLVVAITGAVVVLAVAGARRTSSAYDRRIAADQPANGYVTAFHGADVLSGADELRAAVARTPEIERTELQWIAGTGIALDDGEFANLVVDPSLVGASPSFRTQVLEGRLPKATSLDEVVVNEALVDLLGVEVGQDLVVPTFDPETFRGWQLAGGPFPALSGPELRVRVVGVARLDADLAVPADGRLVILASPALLGRWGDAIGAAQSSVSYWVRAGEDPAAVAAELEATLPADVDVFAVADDVGEEVRTATDLMAAALWASGVVAGVASLLVIAGIVGRHVDGSARANRSLVALGVGRRGRSLTNATPAALALAAGTLGAMAVAVIASPLVPFGYARLVELDHGVFVDPVALAGGAAGLIVLGTAVTLGQAGVADRRLGRRGGGSVRPLGRAPDTVSVPVGLGIRRALRSPRSLVAGAALVAAVTTTSILGASASALVERPDRWGWTWSASPEIGFGVDRYDAAVADLDAQHGVEVGTILSGRVEIDQSPLEVIATEGVEIVVLEGRLPRTDQEVALGRRSLAELDLDIGGVFSIVDVDDVVREFHVVGIVIPPFTPGGHHPGEGAVVVREPSVIDHLIEDNDGIAFAVAVTYADAVDATALEAALSADPGWLFPARAHPHAPGAILNLQRAQPVGWWLAGLLAILWVARLHHGLTSSRRDDRRDVDTLVAVGMRPAEVCRMFSAEAVTTATIDLLFGVAVGVLVARLLWQTWAARLGVAPTTAVPTAAVVASLGVTLLIAGVSGHRAGHVTLRGHLPGRSVG
jgi:hypothetical protein